MVSGAHGATVIRRIPIACDYCRKRKIKCNGERPCQNCEDPSECVYSARKERRKRGPRSLSKSGGGTTESESTTIQTLNNRILSLELMLSNLVTKLDGLKTSKSSSDSSSPEEDLVPHTPGTNDSSPNDVTAPADEDPDAVITATSKPKRLSKYSNLLIRRKPTSNKIKVNRNHSYFCIISEKSLDWIKRRLRPQDLKVFFSMERLPLLLNAAQTSLAKAWVNVPKELKQDITPRYSAQAFPSGSAGVSAGKNLCDFPKDPKLVYGLLKAYYRTIFIANFIVDYEVVTKLFERYYENKPENDNDTGPIFKYSELLIMNIALALAIENKGTVWSKFTELYTMEDLLKLQSDCFNNCVYFYERIHVVSEGFITVQAVLLLSTYADVHYPTDFYINNMLCSVAIRFAQEIGLNRLEAYDEMNEADMELSKRIWWYCQCLDMETCFKTGKPPLINIRDVSTLTELDTSCPYSLPYDKYYSSVELVDICNIAEAESQSRSLKAHIIYCHYWLAFNNIRNASYYELFSANSQRAFSLMLYSKQLDTINGINKKMFKLIEKMDPIMRPIVSGVKANTTNKDQNKFSMFYVKNEDFLYETSVMFKASFYNHMMIINRVPIIVLNPDYFKELSCELLSMECARNQIQLLKDMDCHRIGRFQYNLLQQYGFVAYLTMISKYLLNPTTKAVCDDFPQLASYSMDVVSKGAENYTREDWKRLKAVDNRSLVIMLIVRMTLKVLVGVVESETNINLCENQPRLIQHLSVCEDMLPEVFEEASEKMTGLGLRAPPVPISTKCDTDLASTLAGNSDQVRSTRSRYGSVNPTSTNSNTEGMTLSGWTDPSNSSDHSNNSNWSHVTAINPNQRNIYQNDMFGSTANSTPSGYPGGSFSKPTFSQNHPLNGISPQSQLNNPLFQETVISHDSVMGSTDFEYTNTDSVDYLQLSGQPLLINSENSNTNFGQGTDEFADFMDVDAISNLLFSQAVNFPNSFFEGVS